MHVLEKKVVIIRKISYTKSVCIRGDRIRRERIREMMKVINKSLLSLTLLLLLTLAACKKQDLLYDSEEPGEELPSTNEREAEPGREAGVEEAPTRICVYVCGQVANPGVYVLAAEARIGEAVEAAGGMTPEAADTWLNLAEHMTDGQKIEVPSREEAQKLEEQADEQKSSLVNLNTATVQELTTLRGIGESKAEDILNYREQHGGFGTIEELMQIPGIKERVFEKIKDQITV